MRGMPQRVREGRRGKERTGRNEKRKEIWGEEGEVSRKRASEGRNEKERPKSMTVESAVLTIIFSSTILPSLSFPSIPFHSIIPLSLTLASQTLAPK